MLIIESNVVLMTCYKINVKIKREKRKENKTKEYINCY